MSEKSQVGAECTTRYVVGEKLIGVCFVTPGFEYFSFSMPWAWNPNDPYPAIIMTELEVTKHHKVYSEYDEKDKEPKHDGFVLKDKDGNIWHNQYPHVSYGQLSTEGDQRFNKKIESEEEVKRHIDGNIPHDRHLLTAVYRKVCDGIRDLSSDKNKEIAEKNNRTDHCNMLVQKLKWLKKKLENELLKNFNMVFKEETPYADCPEIKHYSIVKKS